MIDLHCHILPQMDDGARDIYDTLKMASLAVNCGTKVIVATPHCNVPGDYANYYDSFFRENLMKARQAIEHERIPLKLLPGMEVFVTYDLPELIKNGKILTINQSNYLLTEFGFREDPEFVEIMVDRLMEMKIKPVIAHPERYEFIKEDLELARRLKKKGCIFQANKGSFLGRYGESSEVTVWTLAKENLISVVASDAHSPKWRTPYMTEAWHAVQDITDAAQLFEINPQKICMNQPLN